MQMELLKLFTPSQTATAKAIGNCQAKTILSFLNRLTFAFM